jgi:murein DD-endopeptidase MepM/ murein hydrolase activator NlpD
VVQHPAPGFPVTQDFYENPQNYAKFNLPGHNGTDYGTPAGTKVRCTADGVVAFSGVDKDYGIYVRVYHEQLKAHSFYAHLGSAQVTVGARIWAGNTVGLSGNTGNSTGPHLHFEIRLGDAVGYAANTPMPKGRIDPRSWLAINGVSASG